MINRISFIIITIIISSLKLTSVVANGYNIEVQINGLNDTSLMMAYHWGERKYINDTIRLDENGYGVFIGENALPGGIYLVVFPGMSYIEVLIDQEQNFSLETSIADPLNNIEIKGSDEGSLFVEYQIFMNEKQAARSGLQERINAGVSNPEILQQFQKQISEIDSEVRKYWDNVIHNHTGSLLANMLLAMKDPEIPEFDIPPGTENPDSVRWTMGYEYNKSHFFDNMNFSDERLIRTPILHNRLVQFFDRILIKDPAYVIPEAIKVIELSKSNDLVFEYVLTYLLYYYETSGIMGLDEVFVELAERYYLSGEAFWADEESLDRVRFRVNLIKPNLIGRTAPELSLINPRGEEMELHDVEAEYTILYFYQPSCALCIEVSPRINNLAETYKKSGLEVFAIYTYNDVAEWKDYIEQNQYDWIHVYDPTNRSSFRMDYDISSTPTIYILDSKKTIVAKRIGIDTLEMIIEERLGNNN